MQNDGGSRLSASIVFVATVCLASSATAAKAQTEKAKPAAADRARLLKTFIAEFVKITPGAKAFPPSFSMGAPDGPASERPVRTVTLRDPFAMAKYEVTQELYQAVMGTNPSVWGGPRNSVEMVTWQDAVRFCRRATLLLRQAELITAGEEIRLPTEAEWEYCCRAGTATAYSFGDEATGPGDVGGKASLLDPYGWHTGNAAGNDPPVGALKPNAWGLYDMHGYLWEYVADAWHPNYVEAPSDQRAWEAEKRHVPRVVRGGSWRDRFDLLRSTTRWPVPDHVRSDAIGFRCVKASVVDRRVRDEAKNPED